MKGNYVEAKQRYYVVEYAGSARTLAGPFFTERAARDAQKNISQKSVVVQQGE